MSEAGSKTNVFLGIGVGAHAIHVSSSMGQRSSITSERLRSPDDWVELATYGISLPDRHRLLACVALPSGYPKEGRDEIVQSARLAGWDGVLVVNVLSAAGRGLREREERGKQTAMVVVDSGITSVGILRGRHLNDDSVHPIAGREAREVAVSLRCLLKELPRNQIREVLRRVVVVGDALEIERVGQRQYEKELLNLGAQEIEFELDPFLVSIGAERIAAETTVQDWRRLRRRWR